MRFIGYIADGLRLPEIAAREGIDEKYAKNLRKKVAAAEGLKIAEKRPPTSTERSKMTPYGMTQATALLRGRLGTKVKNQIERKGLYVVDLAAKTGVNQRALNASYTNGSNHDWTLSQLERFAALEGKTFKAFMQELLSDATF